MGLRASPKVIQTLICPNPILSLHFPKHASPCLLKPLQLSTRVLDLVRSQVHSTLFYSCIGKVTLVSNLSCLFSAGTCMILACDLNEMVGIEVAWYWYEIQSYIHGLRRMSWYGFNIWMWMRIGWKGWHEVMCMINITWLIEYDWFVVNA